MRTPLHRVGSMTALHGIHTKEIGSGTGTIHPRTRRHNLPRIRRKNSRHGLTVLTTERPPFRHELHDHGTHVGTEYDSNIGGQRARVEAHNKPWQSGLSHELSVMS